MNNNEAPYDLTYILFKTEINGKCFVLLLIFKLFLSSNFWLWSKFKIQLSTCLL